ncbi:hypothetical protein AMAG_17004 [Allomyces macrogynus ATCC 38327]|uniref:Uncharacterized protein n=1 Tax=Allomyces macrogynus (strain ATCC 38327) TaxID=578462 RepID=A0A0L0TCJ5_ALLM3|nr:hypothetical protein AMAG_17004 [Allomyces macrogynus ATCC 38327]|eukprot:KNE72563.1 hypothetical protein AMAG_17004 [Allomyces macrogynus ATCC 38327]
MANTMSANPTHTPRRRPPRSTVPNTHASAPHPLAFLARALRAAATHPTTVSAHHLVVALLRTLAHQVTEWTRTMLPAATRFWTRLVAHPIVTSLAHRANVPAPLVAAILVAIGLVLLATRPAAVAGVLTRAVPAHTAVCAIESPAAHPSTVSLAKQLLLTLTLISAAPRVTQPRTAAAVMYVALARPQSAADALYRALVRPAAVALAHFVPGSAGMPDTVKRAAWAAAAVPTPVVEVTQWVVMVVREAGRGEEAEWVGKLERWARAIDAAVVRDRVRPTADKMPGNADAVPPEDDVTPATAVDDDAPPRVVVHSGSTETTEWTPTPTAAPVVHVAPVDPIPSPSTTTNSTADNDNDEDDDATLLALHLTTTLPASGKASPAWAPTAATGLATGPGRRPRSASAVASTRVRPANGPRVVRGRAGSSV